MTVEREPHTVALMDRVAAHFGVAGGGAYIYKLLLARFGRNPNMMLITSQAELAEVADPGPPPVVSVLLGAESFAALCRGEVVAPPVKAKPAHEPKPAPAPYVDFVEPTVEPTVVVSPEAEVWTATEERKAVLPPAPERKHVAKHETKSNGKFKTFGSNASSKKR
jgi:hypothetical protein